MPEARLVGCEKALVEPGEGFVELDETFFRSWEALSGPWQGFVGLYERLVDLGKGLEGGWESLVDLDETFPSG